MLEKLKGVLKYWVTDSDNITHSFARAQAVLNITGYYPLCIGMVYLGKWNFDPLTFAGGMGVLMTASGAWIWMDKKSDK